jgi:hypothetical protein
MSNPWFRMYSEFANDPKVQMLTEAMQRRLIMVLCLRCSNALVSLHDSEIAFHLRISDQELAETKALFVTKKFIDKNWNVLNWEKRQFKSDSSKDRVAKHRALQKTEQEKQSSDDVTLQVTDANALEQNRTDTDTDTDTKKEARNSGFDVFWKAWPKSDRKGGKAACLAKWRKAGYEKQSCAIAAHVQSMCLSADWQKSGGAYIPAPLTYLNQARWDGADVGEATQGGMLAGAI